MAILKLDYDNAEFISWYGLAKLFPEMNAQALGFIGNKGKKIMKKSVLSGQMLQYRKGESGDMWKDIKGRSKVSYSIVDKAKAVKISSYPANLFSVGRKLRSGKRETKRKIYVLLKQKIESQLSGIINEFDRKILDKKLSKF